MSRQRCKSFVYVVFSLLVVLGGSYVPAHAISSESTNFGASEIEFGSGSTLETCSGQYCASASIGNLSGGEQSSGSHSVNFGNIINDSEPLLEVIVESGDSNLGVLSLDKTATKTMLVKIRTYLSDGYTLSIVGDPPRYEDHYLATSDSPEYSTAGSEQFGLNAIANTAPVVGSNPVQVPSDSISFGQVEEDYSKANQFKYQAGDIIAKSLSESGQTNFTISMIVNISNTTPAGHFTGDFSAVVMPVF